jgi:hypothetical protein
VHSQQSSLPHVGVRIGKYICSSDKTVSIEAEIATVARAVAEAVAITSIECTVVGDGSGGGTASAKAAANATASAEAIGYGWASVETCNGCKAAAELLVKSSTTAFVSAIAESKTAV